MILRKTKIKLAKTADFLRNVIDEYNLVISTSWGKDSSLVVWIIYQILKEKLPLVYMDSGYAFPDTYNYRDKILDEWNIKNYQEIKTPIDYWNVIKKHGLPGINRTESQHQKVIKLIKKEPLDDFVKENRFDGTIWGIRADETKGRKHLLKNKGMDYKVDGIRKLSPIAWFTGDEVWQIYKHYNIPYNPVYDKTLPGFYDTKKDVKNGSWLTTDRAKKGRLVWIKKYYPDRFNKLASIYPEVRQYV